MPQRTGEPPASAQPASSAQPAPPERIDAGPAVLRRVRVADAEQIARVVAANLDHLRPWMPWATPEAAGAVFQAIRLAEAEEMWDCGGDYIYSVLPAGEEATIAGQVGLHRRVGDGGIEIGYWVAASHTGRGLASAAARALTEAALALPDVVWVEIHCDEANAPSAAIPPKLGYRLDRVETREPGAPGETGRLLVWVKERPGPGRQPSLDQAGSPEAAAGAEAEAARGTGPAR